MGPTIKTSDRAHARRAAPWIRRGGGAVLMSAALHAAAAVTIGGVLAFATAPSGPAPEPAAVDVAVDVAVISAPEVPLPQSAPTPPAPAVVQPGHAAPTAHRHSAARSPTATPAVAPSMTAPPANEPPMIFALSAGTVASRPARAAPATSPGLTARSPVPVSSAGAGDSAAVGEREVDVPARLLAAGALAYPSAARQAEIEIDFPLEIIVDAGGHVVSARAPSHAGYGLDEAALQGIRGYRFSPAMRAGRAVAVRMRWVVQFRLR